jgi:hypothetical protein
MRVSTIDLVKDIGTVTDRALIEPVTVTKEGRDRFVLISVEEYSRLKERDRRVASIRELTDEEIEAIAKADVPAEYAYLNEELERE